MRTFLLALGLIFIFPVTTYADIDCSDVRSKNRDECVRAKRNNSGNNINCSDAKDKNRDECVEAKRNRRDNDFDKDDVECNKIDDARIRRECRQRKRD